MNLFKKPGGFMDQIRCDETSYLIWKWHPKDVQEGEVDRENVIRWGSSLRVKDGEVAVFVYKQKDGTMEDFIVGPFDETIKTSNFPVLASIVGLAYDGGTPFQAEVYFINLAQIVQVQFGVPFFEVYDSRFSDFGVPVSVRGTISFKIEDYKNFIKLHRLVTFDLEDFQTQIKDVVCRYIKDVVTNTPAQHNIPLIQIETKISEVNDAVELNIKERLKEDFGVSVAGVDIATIELDKSSDAYSQLMSVTKDIASATIKAEAEAKVKDIADKQRIEVEDLQEKLRIEREEGQYKTHISTQTANMGAYQIEKQAEVGIAGAEALGKMGSNGASDINLGNGDGLNMAGVMASMALGGAVGQNLAGNMNNMMNNMNQPNNNVPPIPNVVYHVAINGQLQGPYDVAMINQLINSGQINKDTLVWKKGMPDWEKAETINELKDLFVEVPPIPSTE